MTSESILHILFIKLANSYVKVLKMHERRKYITYIFCQIRSNIYVKTLEVHDKLHIHIKIQELHKTIIS